uniref:ST8 alpha-N-acetyl-neuraminide alpha-2,8-sialyltransferase 1 n=1 Tax=Saimiri boliviensis boliviensis TaxID=39432 RepID=A0A2K6TBE7_SAIBB
MSPCGRARRQTSRGAMAVLAWKFPRTRLPMGASALCVVVLCWLYIFPVYRLPNEKEIVQGVLQQGTAWRRNQTAARAFSHLIHLGCGITVLVFKEHLFYFNNGPKMQE